MPNYRYIASYSRFIPDKHDADGRSLLAEAGMVVQWDSAPSTAEWVETDEPVNWGAQEAVSVPEPTSEPVPAPEPDPVPVAPEPASEPAPEVAPEFAPPPDPEPVPDGPQPHVATPAFGRNAGSRGSYSASY